MKSSLIKTKVPKKKGAAYKTYDYIDKAKAKFGENRVNRFVKYTGVPSEIKVKRPTTSKKKRSLKIEMKPRKFSIF